MRTPLTLITLTPCGVLDTTRCIDFTFAAQDSPDRTTCESGISAWDMMYSFFKTDHRPVYMSIAWAGQEYERAEMRFCWRLPQGWQLNESDATEFNKNVKEYLQKHQSIDESCHESSYCVDGGTLSESCHTRFWIWAAHGRSDQEQQSKDLRNMHGTVALLQNFTFARSLCVCQL